MQACAAFAPFSCAPPSSGSQLEGRTLAGRYRVGRLIGAGAMGRVFAAEHIDLGRACAVKVIHLPDGEHGDHDARDRLEAVARFRTEALAASRMDHPNVLRVLDFGREPDGLHYLVTEQLDGVDLVDLVTQEERLETTRAIHIVRQMCSALQHAHDRGVVHRDIKPENVRLVRREGDDGRVAEVVKLLDFGTAFLSDGTAPSGRLVIGTPAYMSPEQASGEPVDARSDLYSVGVMMFELATGRLPFERASAVALAAAHIECPPPAPSSLDERVSPALEEIILWCLQKDPSKRPQSSRQLRAALDRLVGELARSEPLDAEITIELDEPAVPRVRRASRLRPRAVAAIAAAAFGALAAIAVRVAAPAAVESASAAEPPAVVAPATATTPSARPLDVTPRGDATAATAANDISRPRRGERSAPRSPPFQPARARPREVASKGSLPQATPDPYALAAQADAGEPPARAADTSAYEPDAVEPKVTGASAPTSTPPSQYAPEGI